MYTPMFENHVNGCHGNHAFFIEQKSLSLTTKMSFISGIPMNDLAPLKDSRGRGCARYTKLAPGYPEINIRNVADQTS